LARNLLFKGNFEETGGFTELYIGKGRRKINGRGIATHFGMEGNEWQNLQFAGTF
jgi:hypothetical protein